MRVRAVGLDWPLQGMTMSGLRRLDDLEACVDSVVNDRVDGDFIEAGTWRGGATILMRAALDSLGDRERTVWVADSFQGFPDADRQKSEPASVNAQLEAYDFLAVPVQEVRDNFDGGSCDSTATPTKRRGLRSSRSTRTCLRAVT